MTGQEIANILLSSEILKNGQQDKDMIIVRHSGYLPYYRELVTHRKGIVAKIVIFTKRVIRKMIRFIVEPICVEQSLVNEYYGREIRMLKEELRELKEKTEREV